MTIFSELCQAMEIEHGSMFPKEVIEGSSVTVICDKGFRVEGDWLLRCTDGNLTGSDFTDVFPRCVHIRNGKIPIYHQAYKISTIQYPLNIKKCLTWKKNCLSQVWYNCTVRLLTKIWNIDFSSTHPQSFRWMYNPKYRRFSQVSMSGNQQTNNQMCKLSKYLRHCCEPSQWKYSQWNMWKRPKILSSLQRRKQLPSRKQQLSLRKIHL